MQHRTDQPGESRCNYFCLVENTAVAEVATDLTTLTWKFLQSKKDTWGDQGQLQLEKGLPILSCPEQM